MKLSKFPNCNKKINIKNDVIMTLYRQISVKNIP